MSLYNKIRPHAFSEVIGQASVKKALQKESVSEKYFRIKIFHGVRGTGKTTLAKTTLMAANCLGKLPNGDPCGCCANCRAILADDTMDFVEMDAASNNSVDDIRDLIEKMSYPPMTLQYKSYIIDEFHMLSTAAFNALLKTTEYLPEHCFIILCTTEFEKVPETLKSRSQKYEFKRLSSFQIQQYLISVAKKEGLRFTDDACAVIARRSDGVMRSALVDLETLADPNGTVSAKDVEEVFGITEDESRFSFLKNMLNLDETAAIRDISEYEKNGKNPFNLVDELLETLKDIAVYKASGSVISSDVYREYLAGFNDISMRRVNNLSVLVNGMRDGLREDPSIRNFYALTIQGIRELEKLDHVQIAETVPKPSVNEASKGQPEAVRKTEGKPWSKTEEPKPATAPPASSLKPEKKKSVKDFVSSFFSSSDGEEDEEDDPFSVPVTESRKKDSEGINEGFERIPEEDAPFAPSKTTPFQQYFAEREPAAPSGNEGKYPVYLRSDKGLSLKAKLAFDLLRYGCDQDDSFCLALEESEAEISDDGITVYAPDGSTQKQILMFVMFFAQGEYAKAKESVVISYRERACSYA